MERWFPRVMEMEVATGYKPCENLLFCVKTSVCVWKPFILCENHFLYEEARETLFVCLLEAPI